MKKVPERKSRRQTDQIGALLRTLRSTEKHLLGVRVLKSKIVPKKTAVSKAREEHTDVDGVGDEQQVSPQKATLRNRTRRERTDVTWAAVS